MTFPDTLRRCLSWHKDTNFKANHNGNKRSKKDRSDVCLGTKIRILKQITTFNLVLIASIRCLSWHKDTNFKANHNSAFCNIFLFTDVCLGTKIRILKQITTNYGNKSNKQRMFVLAQRYEF